MSRHIRNQDTWSPDGSHECGSGAEASAVRSVQDHFAVLVILGMAALGSKKQAAAAWPRVDWITPVAQSD